MCGIAGIVHAEAERRVGEEPILRMARSVRHRGPDGYGTVFDHGAGFVSTRLSIVDLPGGWQPIEAAPGGPLIVYNGEVYNHPELRRELEAAGERLGSSSDTEVVLRVLERHGVNGLERLNGQFALAWWSPAERRLVLARDRFGVRPLHYSVLHDGTLVFGSEAKALFASGLVEPRPDLEGLDQVFTLWGTRAPRTVFQGVRQVPPGGLVVWQAGKVVEERSWWSPAPWEARDPGASLEELLRSSVELRLRADVPVGAYLSGGLDSTLISALAQERVGGHLRTFSIAFADRLYDERGHQEQAAEQLGTVHHVVEAGSADIAAAFPEVVRHVEAPLIRTAPVPMYLLAEQVRREGITVVVTGEGADELFWGYDLFKEVALRELHEREPALAEQLLDDLYPYLGDTAHRGPAWRRFLLAGDPSDPLSSHLTRAAATGTVRAFYRSEVAEALSGRDQLALLRDELPAGFARLSALERASWLEIATLLEPYLLAAQGDRVAMAHGVEGRYPFLDHRVFAHAARLDPARKLDGLADKVALRELAAKLLPPSLAERPKQPYRAPAIAPFVGPDRPAWVDEAVSPESLDATGIWDPKLVGRLLERCRSGRATGIREGMALVGVLSTQVWHEAFVASRADAYPPETAAPRVRLDRTGERAPHRAA